MTEALREMLRPLAGEKREDEFSRYLASQPSVGCRRGTGKGSSSKVGQRLRFEFPGRTTSQGRESRKSREIRADQALSR